ncbi:hypothetical protein C789_1472 [Microcystis aeruginosa FACHB-905 = DIANCHI905]|nr:hypothetical protein C789_1472 [Microcystis aeruginosa FACHB-905 = DIANCHI905]
MLRPEDARFSTTILSKSCTCFARKATNLTEKNLIRRVEKDIQFGFIMIKVYAQKINYTLLKIFFISTVAVSISRNCSV